MKKIVESIRKRPVNLMLLILVVFAYWINNLFLKEHSGGLLRVFFIGYFNDLICPLFFFSFFITTLSITLSVIYKNHIMAVITMVITVLAAPDILTMFSFGKLFPTHLLTFIYNSSGNFAELIIPCITLIVLQLGLCYMAIKRFDKIEIAR